MRHCENCGYLGVSGYEYPESYCSVGIQDNDPKFDEDKDGCGCRYNARTLAKMKRENEHAEYLYYLGYSDYSLMPTMEYTEENEQILEKHRELVRHALGMDNRRTYVRHGKRFYRPYRNYFFTHEKTVDTKVKVGTGRHARMVENHIYKCLRCGWSVRVERSNKPPMYCPNCKSDMRERRTDERT